MKKEVLTALPGNPYEHNHQVELFIGDHRAFAECSCGWKTKTTVRYYSPILNFDRLWELHFSLSNAATDHEIKMSSAWWRLRRIIREAYLETAAYYQLGKKR